jgi:hypothetical protein
MPMNVPAATETFERSRTRRAVLPGSGPHIFTRVSVAAERGVERNGLGLDCIERAIGPVEAVGDVRENHRSPAAEERLERLRQDLVGPVARVNVVRVQPEARGNRRRRSVASGSG